jgi:hypothetical protein
LNIKQVNEQQAWEAEQIKKASTRVGAQDKKKKKVRMRGAFQGLMCMVV